MHCVTILQKTYVHVRQYLVVLLYIILWSEQKCVAGNIMKNNKVYCLIRVCSCFVIILKFSIFLYQYNRGLWRRDVVASLVGGCFTDVLLHSSKNCYQERTTEPHRLPKAVQAACQSVQILICDFNFPVWWYVFSVVLKQNVIKIIIGQVFL
jgi:hypothetical protein